MADDRVRLGKWGENVAAEHLKSLGWVELNRNWRNVRGEIDLVFRDGETLVLVEVKTRRGAASGEPEEGLTEAKGNRLLTLGQIYVAEHSLDTDWRVDLVAIETDLRGSLKRLEHIESAVVLWP